MRGETAMENGVEGDDHGEPVAATDTATGERRPSIVPLQNMLKKVSQSPFHNQYKTLLSSPSDSSGTSVNKSRNRQDGEFLSDLSAAPPDATDNHQLHLGQNGVNGNLARMNPFYSHYLESSGKGHVMEAVGMETSEGADLSTIFAPPPEFQRSTLDLQPEIKTLENADKSSEPQKDLFQSLTHNHMQDLFHTSTLTPNTSANGHFHIDTLDSSDLFKANPPQTENLSSLSLQSKNSDLFKGEVEDPLQAAKGTDLLHTAHAEKVNLFDKSPSSFVDPFKSPSNKADDLFQSSQPTVVNPFYTAPNNGADLFQAVPTKSGEYFNVKKNKQDPSTKEGTSLQESLDIFSSSSRNTVNPFPSPITRDLFQDFSSLEDPFGTTPSKQYDPFQDLSNGTPDIFQPLPSKTNGSDISEITPSNTASKAAYSTPSFNSTPELKLDTLSSPDLSEATLESLPAIQPKPFNTPGDVVLTTPKGTKHDILQPTPFSQAINLSVPPSHSPSEMTHVPTFRRPPKPLPRTRPPRTAKPPKPEKPPTPAKPIKLESTVPKTPPKPAFKPLPKPVIHRKPKTPEKKPVEDENYVVFEDVLLTGQERCVEDWPEDSPQLNPDFKPSGKLRLRRESLKKTDSDGGSGEDQDASGSQRKKKDKKFRMSLLRRGSKDKFPDDTKENRSRTLPISRKSSQEYFSELQMAAGENEENGMDYKKKPPKTKVNRLLRRASTTSSVPEGKHLNEHLAQESKDDVINKKSNGKKNSIIRRWSEGTVLDDNAGEEKDGGEADREERRRGKLKIQFVPHRGFAITVKKADDDLKGAHGYTPRKGSKDKQYEEVLGAHGYTPRKKSQDNAFEDTEEMKGHHHQSSTKAAFMDDAHLHTGLSGDEDAYGMEDCKPKRPTKKKLPHVGRRSSKEDMLDDTRAQKKKSSFSAEELDDDELNGIEDSKQDIFAEDEIKGKGFMSPEDMYDDEEDELETCKPKTKSKLKGFKKHKAKSKDMHPECEGPPGATCSDFLSEAAKAEWLAAQQDERARAGLEDEDEEGDTDSLMEWWYTVEQWDEVPSDEESKVLQEDESKSFTILADKVHHGLRVFNKVFTERAEVLWQSIITLHTIADDISEFHHKAKIAGITGGTTTAVGGVAAITGLALAPFTFGASLVVTAVGVGVATAGGITSASAAISDNVNNMHDQKKVEAVLKEYEGHLLDIAKILHFVNQGLYKLRGHPFLRSGTQHYSEDWEIRRAVQIISLVDSPVMQATQVTDEAVASVQGLFEGVDKYFIKDSRELKKGCKKEIVGQIKEVANRLNDAIVELNTIREELQDATGNM
ncbi:uncharacterized protein [Trachinotus anak]|uniref:uncharacterized protein isoform X2 n=1 Tax=Trachinotus anak TaxID=443729 RepID=UPI0039F24737